MGELEEVFRALADKRRRHVLFCLKEHQSVSLADLAEFVAEREKGKHLTEISSEAVRDVYFTLYHNHVPVLEKADLVHYEQEEDLVVQTEQTVAHITRTRDTLDSLLKDKWTYESGSEFS